MKSFFSQKYCSLFFLSIALTCPAYYAFDSLNYYQYINPIFRHQQLLWLNWNIPNLLPSGNLIYMICIFLFLASLIATFWRKTSIVFLLFIIHFYLSFSIYSYGFFDHNGLTLNFVLFGSILFHSRQDKMVFCAQFFFVMTLGLAGLSKLLESGFDWFLSENLESLILIQKPNLHQWVHSFLPNHASSTFKGISFLVLIFELFSPLILFCGRKTRMIYGCVNIILISSFHFVLGQAFPTMLPLLISFFYPITTIATDKKKNSES